MAHKKGMGSSRNGSDSNAKRLGVKRADGQFGTAGSGGITATGGGFGEQDKTQNNKIGTSCKLFFIISILGVK